MKLVLEDLTDAQIEAIRALIDKENIKVEKWEPKGWKWYLNLADVCVENASSIDNYRTAGLEYQTKEQAKRALKSVRAHARQLAWLAENDDGWVADWGSTDKPKYSVCYNPKEETYVRDSAWSRKNINSIYMSEQNAERLAKLLNDGIIEF